MKPETVRAVALGVAGLAGAWLIYRAAQYARSVPGNVGAALQQAASEAASTISALPGKMADVVRTATSNITVGLDLPSLGGIINDTPERVSKQATRVNFTQWPASVKSAIDVIKRHRGERVSNNSNDYLRWQVYSDGTFISPAGEYFVDQVMRTVFEGRSLEGVPSLIFNGIGRTSDDGFIPDSESNFWDWKPVYQNYTGWPSVDDIPY